MQLSLQSEKRTITQFHYTAWPDHGTPEELGLVQFHKAVTKKYQSGGLMLVHCRSVIQYVQIMTDYLFEKQKKQEKVKEIRQLSQTIFTFGKYCKNLKFEKLLLLRRLTVNCHFMDL